MRKIMAFSLLLCILLLVVDNVSAQMINWEIKQHSTDIELLEQEVTNYVNNGYIPLGLSYDNVELYILYVRDPDFGMEAWSIEWYENKTEIQNGITDNMNQGYVPTGITYTGDLFYVLYVMIESSATAWQLIPAALDLDAVHDAIQPYIVQGYLPSGITAFEGEYWIMLLHIPDTTAEYWKIEAYETGRHGDEINRNIERGFFPWGLMYRSDRGVDILYVNFK